MYSFTLRVADIQLQYLKDYFYISWGYAGRFEMKLAFGKPIDDTMGLCMYESYHWSSSHFGLYESGNRHMVWIGQSCSCSSNSPSLGQIFGCLVASKVNLYRVRNLLNESVSEHCFNFPIKRWILSFIKQSTISTTTDPWQQCHFRVAFADDMYKCIILNENVHICCWICFEGCPWGSNWRYVSIGLGNRPLLETTMTQFTDASIPHRPQYVKEYLNRNEPGPRFTVKTPLSVYGVPFKKRRSWHRLVCMMGKKAICKTSSLYRDCIISPPGDRSNIQRYR